MEHVAWSPAHIFIGSEGCTMCLRREFLEETKKYWYPGWAHDEYAWKLSLCMDGCYILHSVTLRRRMHSGNVSKRKMRDLDRRIAFFRELQKSHETTLRFAEDFGMPEEAKELLRRNIRATTLRIELMEQRKLWNIVSLLWKYRDCYHSKNLCRWNLPWQSEDEAMSRYLVEKRRQRGRAGRAATAILKIVGSGVLDSFCRFLFLWPIIFYHSISESGCRALI